MKRRRRAKRKRGARNTKPEENSFQVIRFSPPRLDREKSEGRFRVKKDECEVKFRELVHSLSGRFRNRYPPQIISIVAAYGLHRQVTSKGVSERAFVDVIQQYHVEFLQALALTISKNEWGSKPVTPDIVQATIDEVIELGESFRIMRQSALQNEHDKEEQAVLALRDRLRTHTQISRNWGYRTAMVEDSVELYSPLDSTLQNHYGFSATDVIEVAITLIRVMENRAAEHWTMASEILRSRNVRLVAKRLFAQYSDSEVEPGEFERAFPESLDNNAVEARIWSLMDTNLLHLFLFDCERVAEESGRSIEIVSRVLRKLSMGPGDLAQNKPHEFLLNNPIWVAPGVITAGDFFFPMPQIVLSHIHGLMRILAKCAGFTDRLYKRRSKFLENRVYDTIRRILPSAHLTKNVEWRIDGTRFETDLLGRVDRVVLIVEAKSGALTAQGLRGVPLRIKRHVHDLVVSPAKQSARLEQLIWQAKSGETVAADAISALGLEPDKIDTVIRMSVTLDDFSMMAIAERELRAAGWIPPELQIAPTLTFANLATVVDVLHEPAYFLHYFAGRERTQKTIDLIGDEMDLLGLYLETGFNIAEKELEGGPFITSGLSRQVDQFYNSADAGVEVRKPRPKIHRTLEKIVLYIQNKRMEAWSTIALDLLRIGSLDEQRMIFQDVQRLRKRVAKTYRDPAHICSEFVVPAEHIDAFIIFYVFPNAIAGGRFKVAEELARRQFAVHDRSRCIIVGKMIESWDKPYQFVAVYNNPK